MSEDLQRLMDVIEKIAASDTKRLPPEPKLAKEIDVTRGRLRTLLTKLEKDDVIWRHVGKGTFVGPRDLASDPSNWLDGISLNDIMDARLLLEPQLAAQAAISGKKRDIEKLEHCIIAMEKAPSYAHWKRQDDILHRLIAVATNNGLLLLIYDTLRTKGSSELETRLSEVFGHEIAPSDTNQQHKLIVSAIMQGNPDMAAKQMRNHILHVRQQLFGMH